jgi:hypothetical protein
LALSGVCESLAECVVASHVSGGLEDAVFSFAGVDEEPDFVD